MTSKTQTGQGFWSPAVATVITASSIVTSSTPSIANLIELIGCNSDNCKQYCDTILSIFAYLLVRESCNSDNCKQYCDIRKIEEAIYIVLYNLVATVITNLSVSSRCSLTALLERRALLVHHGEPRLLRRGGIAVRQWRRGRCDNCKQYCDCWNTCCNTKTHTKLQQW